MNFEDHYMELLFSATQQKHRQTRNAVTRALFGTQLKVDELVQRHFPILQGRQMFWKGVIGELAAILKGPKHVDDFIKEGCNYWGPWADSDGALRVDYGNAWLDFDGFNQLDATVTSLMEDPNGRRHLINAWRPNRLKNLSLPCCHYAYQWFVNGNLLEMVWIQRSVDLFIGLPSDIILAAAFNILMAQTVGLHPGTITFQLGDTHFYENHYKALSAYVEQIGPVLPPPSWELDSKATVFNFEASMFTITDYKHQPAITVEVIA